MPSEQIFTLGALALVGLIVGGVLGAVLYFYILGRDSTQPKIDAQEREIASLRVAFKASQAQGDRGAVAGEISVQGTRDISDALGVGADDPDAAFGLLSGDDVPATPPSGEADEPQG